MEPKLCRFCFEGDEIDGAFLRPCKCDGSQRYVHSACLERWRKFGPGKAWSTCPVCNAEYKMTKIMGAYEKNLTAETVLVFEGTCFFLYACAGMAIALFIGSVFSGILMGPVLGILKPTQDTLSRWLDLPVKDAEMFYSLCVPGVFFLIGVGVVIFLTKQQLYYIVLGPCTIFIGVALAFGAEKVWNETVDYIEKRRAALLPSETTVVDYYCI